MSTPDVLHAAADTPTSTPLDGALELLANERRRLAIHVVHDYGRQDLRSLSERIAAREHGVDRGEISADDRKRVYINLHQHHMERLVDGNTLTYDEQSKLVGPGDDLDAYVRALDDLDTVFVGGVQQ